MPIRTFRHKGLAELWNDGKTNKIDRRFHKRILDRLDLLEQALMPEDMNVVGFNFHTLLGFIPTRYTIHVNGPWCLTFEFEDGDAFRVDFEQYH
jgi:proteic killer suppression protein